MFVLALRDDPWRQHKEQRKRVAHFAEELNSQAEAAQKRERWVQESYSGVHE